MKHLNLNQKLSQNLNQKLSQHLFELVRQKLAHRRLVKIRVSPKQEQSCYKYCN